ncbi:c-type cytochrome [Rhodoferax ferrireducens]|uniref:c-type cytochrome n=1 Tax=Rhodoferax ferrireducens TaxID=192843 RepID=UPI000E0CDEEF|nr:cytochrome c [Rhodoferax ferrireducens]
MKSSLKWVLWLVVLLALLLVVAVLAGVQMAEHKRMRVITVPVTPVAYTTDAAALERGRYLFQTRGCAECHGANGAGREFVNDGKGTRIVGANITPAGDVAKYTPEDWVRTIRHGVKPDGRPVMVMPSEDYNRFTDADLAAVVAYVRSLPPTAGGGAIVDLPLPARVLYGFDMIPDAAQRINHALPPSTPVASGMTAEHGAYVANMCIGCHGEKLSGGRIPGGPPDWPAAANITPGEGSAMVRYKDADAFVTMLQTGKRPDGSPIAVMPFGSFSKMNDVDKRALFAFLQTVPARAAGQH